ncbi:MAG: hypothetical protein JOZ47_08850 [Kutzneria sp.]|nr:hypothetical protein [Kutzneria sp.]
MWTDEEIQVAKGTAHVLAVTALDVAQAASTVVDQVPEVAALVSVLGDHCEQVRYLISAHGAARHGD